jgi:uncharacterized protein (TIGR02001 family)
MKQQLTSIALAAALGLAAASSAQAEGLSFNIGAVSLYKSNGIDQDSRQDTKLKAFRPAIQGGVDYDFGNGFYVGNWNSTGKFNATDDDDNVIGTANLEIDLYAGFSKELSNGLSYDFGVARYIYPGAAGFGNSNEWYAAFTYGIVTAKYTRGFGNDNRNARFGVSIEQPLSDKLTLKAGVGKRNRVNAGGASDFSLGLAYDMGNDLSLSAMVSGAQTGEEKAGDAGKTRLIVGVSKSF